MKNVGFASLAIVFLFSSLAYTHIPTNLKARAVRGNTAKKPHDALAFHQQFSIDLSEGWAIFNGCPGGGASSDFVNGTFHVLIHGVINAKKIMYNYHSNIQNLVVADSDGTQYTGNAINKISETSKFDGTFTYRYTENITLARPGRGNNGIIRYDVFLTVDADGEVKVLVDNFREECQ
jgi:hypothetical protein